MADCPKCGEEVASELTSHTQWGCDSLQIRGEPFSQSDRCRVGELEKELDRFRQQQGELRQELTDAKAVIEHLRQRYSPFENDPFVVVAQAFAELWPNAPFPHIQIVEGLHSTDDAKWAETLVLSDDDGILVSIDVKAPVFAAVELLAHELAHVACEHLGLRSEDDHGPHWEECFAALHEKFNAEAATAAGGDDAK